MVGEDLGGALRELRRWLVAVGAVADVLVEDLVGQEAVALGLAHPREAEAGGLLAGCGECADLRGGARLG